MLTKEKGRIHFIGIGGIGMSAIASVLNAIGFEITGSDIYENEKTKSLINSGIKIYYGHDASNIKEGTLAVVNSTAISGTNQEMIQAKKFRIPIVGRGEMLAELMRLRKGIAISGAHGKTTTTSLVCQIMRNTEYSPICIIGGNHFNLKSNACFKNLESEYLVCEADESDGSFLHLSPVYNIVTNIDNDHLDYYGNIENIREAFLNFINKVPFYGASFICFENEDLRNLSDRVNKRFFSYGFSKDYDYYVARESIKNINDNTCFTVFYRGESLGEFEFKLIGEHNILNALAAVALSHHLDIDLDSIKSSLLSFEGVDRRLNILYSDKDYKFFDDYAHHPTEIMATLKSLKNVYADRRIIAIFQPHRYSRTELLLAEFAAAFGDSDVVIITDIYAAGEKPIKNVTGEGFASAVKDFHDNVIYVKDMADIASTLDTLKRSGDVMITLGAGNIVDMGRAYVTRVFGT